MRVLRVKLRAATRAKPALVNAVHAFYLGEDVDTEHPDHYITQHSSTGARYPSLHAFYASMGVCNARGKGRGQGRSVVLPVGELKPYNFT